VMLMFTRRNQNQRDNFNVIEQIIFVEFYQSRGYNLPSGMGLCWTYDNCSL